MLFSLLYVFWDYLFYFDMQMTCKKEKKPISRVINQYCAQDKWWTVTGCNWQREKHVNFHSPVVKYALSSMQLNKRLRENVFIILLFLAWY